MLIFMHFLKSYSVRGWIATISITFAHKEICRLYNSIDLS